MPRRLSGLSICCFVSAGVLLAACGGGSADGAASSAGMAPPANAAASPEDQAAEFQRQFEANRRQIEEERQRQEEQLQHRRSFVAVAFQEIDGDGRVIVTLTNQSDSDIDDIRGGIQAHDADGNYLAATGFTEAVPGSVLLPVGTPVAHTPYGFDTKQELIEHLRSDPASVQFSFEVLSLTYADGTEEPGLDG